MREVEITAKELQQEQMLTKWIRGTLGRSFTVPVLEGLKFVGGRVFFVNVAPTGFCFSPAPHDETTELSKGRDGDLNMIYWEKVGLRYILLGWADRDDKLMPLAEELRETYGGET